MTVRELVEKSRSYRGFRKDRKVTKEELLALAECARLCPSTGNIQPLKYYLAWETEEVAEIQSLSRWAKGLPEMRLPHPGMEPAAFIVICQDTRIDPASGKFQRDVGIAAQTILLAAAERGLGGCMIGSFPSGDLKNRLRLPDWAVPMLLVAIGEPAETVILTQVGEDGSTGYYRDEEDRHYVPKRRLEEVTLDKFSL